jgi:hypothetical protein
MSPPKSYYPPQEKILANSPNIPSVPPAYHPQYYPHLPYGYHLPPYNYHPEQLAVGKG